MRAAEAEAALQRLVSCAPMMRSLSFPVGFDLPWLLSCLSHTIFLSSSLSQAMRRAREDANKADAELRSMTASLKVWRISN